jgi:hypothetical protein
MDSFLVVVVVVVVVVICVIAIGFLFWALRDTAK